ncbi:MAG: slipin family protein [Candidatus Tectomicrobia bacterium]
MTNIAFVLIVVAVILFNVIKILREWERGVILRLGKFQAVRGPGIIFIIPLIEKMTRISTRIITVDVPPQDIITRDNVTMSVNAVVFFRVLSPREAIVNVEEFGSATLQKAQTVLRNVLGQSELDELLTERDAINTKLQAILDAETDQWGIKVDSVEIKHVDLPQEMQRAMARQAEAERERRAKVIAAEGEFQASTRLAEAADIMGRHPISLQLRYLQTLSEVATENNSTLVFPIPIDLVKPFLDRQPQSPPSNGGQGPTGAVIAAAEDDNSEATPPAAQ